MNPYVIQMDRFAQSLKHLSETFLSLEEYKGAFTKDEVEEMFLRYRRVSVKDARRKSGALRRIEVGRVRWYMKSFVRWRITARS